MTESVINNASSPLLRRDAGSRAKFLAGDFSDWSDEVRGVGSSFDEDYGRRQGPYSTATNTLQPHIPTEGTVGFHPPPSVIEKTCRQCN